MVDLTVCKSCSAPVAPGHAFCPRCGAALGVTESASGQVGAAGAGEPSSDAKGASIGPNDPRLAAQGVAPPQTDSPAAGPAASAAPETIDVGEVRRSTARDNAVRAAAAAREAAAKAAAAREAAAKAAAEKVAAVNAARDTEAEMDSDEGTGPAPEPVVPGGARASDRILMPSATNRTLGSIGAGRPGGPLAAPTSVPSSAQAPNLASGSKPTLVPAPDAGAVAGRSGGLAAGRTPPATPVVPLTMSDRIRTTLASIAAEPKAELTATGLTALGGALALVSFALPWAGDNGLGVGTVDIHPRSGAWAFDTAAGWPLFVIAAVLLAAILASDKLEELLPALAPIIRRLTETAAPMLLGGILLGVGVVYQTLPWGCGGGIALLALGAVLLIAGSIVGLFFPAGQRRD